MAGWEVLSGLPPYGSPALNFSATGQGKHREGFVVKFLSDANEPWIGNFQRGLTEFCEVVAHPDGDNIIVIAGGEAYVVSPSAKQCLQTFGGQIGAVLSTKELELILFVSLVDVTAIGKSGVAWRSRRISWDGFRGLHLDGHWLIGEAYSPVDEPDWRPFRVYARTGQVEGGTYTT
jgi:hypothetical protein